jgi:lipid-binding SYLF domain-containing protein
MKNEFVARHVVAIGLIVGLSAIAPAYAGEVQEAAETVKLFKKTDPGLDHFFKGSAGYAVFPNVGKGALGIGGAHGPGILYEHGKPVGKTTLTQVTIGLQMGGQAYAEIIFFETDKVLSNFKGGNFEFSGQVSAVAVRAGASANAKYRDGVAVFTATRGGLMFEASIGGQKFSYEPFAKKK